MEELSKIASEHTFAINTVWVALCAALIFFMEAGFALLEAGFVRSKNAMSIIAKVIIDITFGGLAFFIVGFGIAYGSSNGWFAFDIGINQSDLGLDLTVSNNLFWFIQLGFAIAAISIVSGALAERMKLWSYAILVILFCALLYPLVANWVWNPNGWLAAKGFNDFAGSAAVHAMGGFSALAAAIVLGPRLGKYSRDGKVNTIPGHNLPLAAIGGSSVRTDTAFSVNSSLPLSDVVIVDLLNTRETITLTTILSLQAALNVEAISEKDLRDAFDGYLEYVLRIGKDGQ